MARNCEFRRKGGERCNADAQTGKGVCVFHDKASDDRRARRAGGITRSRVATVLPFDTPDHPLGDTNQVSVLLADSINRLRRGQLDPRVANAMGYLASVLLKALENGRIEDRLARLESVQHELSGTSRRFPTPALTNCSSPFRLLRRRTSS
jgi:hypothetical protein